MRGKYTAQFKVTGRNQMWRYRTLTYTVKGLTIKAIIELMYYSNQPKNNLPETISDHFSKNDELIP